MEGEGGVGRTGGCCCVNGIGIKRGLYVELPSSYLDYRMVRLRITRYFAGQRKAGMHRPLIWVHIHLLGFALLPPSDIQIMQASRRSSY